MRADEPRLFPFVTAFTVTELRECLLVSVDMLKGGRFFKIFVQSEGDSEMRQVFRKIVLSGLLALAVAGMANATEGGGSAYHNGAEDFMSGAVPPPGNYYINYFNYYAADKFNVDGDDKKGFDLKVAADVSRFIHVTDKQFLGGSWALHAFIPLVYMDVNLDPPIAPVSMDDRRGSLGDIIVDPFILAWHGANWHAVTGLDIFMPTGNYDKSRLANVGRNYWTFEPVAAATFLPGAGFDISAKLMYDFNTENDATDYLSGQEFHADIAVGKKMDNFTAGLAGYYYQQTTEDEADGDKIDNKGRVIGLGPALKYDYKNMSFTLKYMLETEAKNRPEGDNFWFKFLYAF